MLEKNGDSVDTAYQIPDRLWERMRTQLPPPKPKKKSGRPRMGDRLAMNAIFYVLRTGCQWKALPRSLGARSTVHDRFQEWRSAGVFQRLWKQGLAEYDAKKGLDWRWQAIDTAMTKAPLGGKRHRPKPDRSTQVWNEAKPTSGSTRHTHRTNRCRR